MQKIAYASTARLPCIYIYMCIYVNIYIYTFMYMCACEKLICAAPHECNITLFFFCLHISLFYLSSTCGRHLLGAIKCGTMFYMRHIHISPCPYHGKYGNTNCTFLPTVFTVFTRMSKTIENNPIVFTVFTKWKGVYPC